MRLVFEKFETPLELRTDALNVLRIQDQSLYARCALSLSQGFPPDCLEPASFFTKEDKEVKPKATKPKAKRLAAAKVESETTEVKVKEQ